MLFGHIGWVAAVSGASPVDSWTWYEVLDLPLDGPGPASDITVRTRYAVPPMDGPCGEWLRFKLLGASTGAGTISEMWAGKVARATGGIPMDSPVQVTARGGAASVTLAMDEELWTDPIYLPIDPEEEDLVVSVYFAAAAGSLSLTTSAPAGVTGTSTPGNSAASTSSFGTPDDTAYVVAGIESDVECGPGGHRYWRLRLDAGGVHGDSMSLAGVQLRTGIGGTDVAGSSTITASSTFTSFPGPYPASNVLDADTATFWAASNANKGWNEHLTFDFGVGEVANIVEVALRSRSGTDSQQAPLTGALLYSDDGSTWTEAFWFASTSRFTSSQLKGFSAPAVPDNDPHRYWEILCVRSTTTGAAVTTSNAAIAELAFRESAGGANAISGGTASASDASFGAAANAIDGNAGTFWASANPSMMQWWRYDFGSGNDANIREVAVTARNDAAAHQAPGQIVVRYSDNGTDWTIKYVSEVLSAVYTAGQTKVFTEPGL